MAKYRRRPEIVDAVQWFKHGDHPAVKNPCCTSTHGHLKGSAHHDLPYMTVAPGCWIITMEDGCVGRVTAEDFQKYYEPVED